MAESSKEIHSQLQSAWRRTFLGIAYRRILWSLAIALASWTLFLHLALRTGWWQPTPLTVLQGTMWIAGLAIMATIASLRGQGFAAFLSKADRDRGDLGLRAWLSLRRQAWHAPVESLFLSDLSRRVAQQALTNPVSFRVPGICRALFAFAALGLLFLLMPWGGSAGFGIAPRSAPELQTKDEPSPVSTDAEPQTAKADPKPVPTTTQPSPKQDRLKNPPRPLEPKFVPGQEGEGPKSWKETLLYDLPIPGENGLPLPQPGAPSSTLDAWKRVAEGAIAREKLDDDEARLVARYFDKLRP